jgi:hypothetical protein
VLTDGGAGVLRDSPGSRDARLWAHVRRSIEGRAEQALLSLASSQAWQPGARAGVDLLPFFAHSSVDDGASGTSGACQICRRDSSCIAFRVEIFGPIVNSAGLAGVGSATAALRSVAPLSPASPTRGAVAASVSAASAAPITTWWADHIPRGDHAVYRQTFMAGRNCRQRFQAYAALRHFKLRLLYDLSTWLRNELAWPPLLPHPRVSSLGPPWPEHTELLLRHVRARASDYRALDSAAREAADGSAEEEDDDYSEDDDLDADAAEATDDGRRGGFVSARRVSHGRKGGPRGAEPLHVLQLRFPT